MKIKHAESFASKLFKMDGVALRQALQIDDDSVDEIDENKFIELMVSKQSDVIKERFDRGYQKAQGEVLTKLEKEIRSEFDIDSTDLKGVDLVKHVTEKVREDATKTAPKSKLTDDDVKKHPVYLELEKAKTKEIQTVKTEYETKIKAEQDARQYEKTLAVVTDKAKAYFKELGEAVLPDDANVADRIVQKLLIEEISNGRKFEANGDDFIALKADGTREEDKAGNAKSLKDIVAEVAKTNFQFKAGSDKKFPGNGGDDKPPKPGAGGGKYKGAAPKTSEDYVKLLLSADLSIEEKSEVKDVYGSQFTQAQ